MSGPDSVARLIKSKLINANVFINRVIKHPKSPGSGLGSSPWLNNYVIFLTQGSCLPACRLLNMHQKSPQGVPVSGRKSRNRSKIQGTGADFHYWHSLVVGNYARKGLAKLFDFVQLKIHFSNICIQQVHKYKEGKLCQRFEN